MNPIEPAPPQRMPLPLTRPVLVWGLFGLNILTFIVETLLGGSENSATLVRLGAKVNILIAMGDYWRLITPMFLHIGVMHILVNSYALYVLGPEVESLFGHAGGFIGGVLLGWLLCLITRRNTVWTGSHRFRIATRCCASRQAWFCLSCC